MVAKRKSKKNTSNSKIVKKIIAGAFSPISASKKIQSISRGRLSRQSKKAKELESLLSKGAPVYKQALQTLDFTGISMKHQVLSRRVLDGAKFQKVDFTNARFKSTKFNDDMDRALQKNDGSWTYFANDIAYHMDKISRKYDYLINVLGADHTGYIKRITAAVRALSNNKVSLDCRVCRLVKLYKKGKPFKMSKRSGDFISVNDLLSEVDKDSIRFMMLNRSNDVELDFDFDKVLEKTKENPVYYVQYSYARINSLFRTLKINIDDEIDIDEKSFNLNIYEKNILRKIFDWPKIVETASTKYEPHRIPFYLYDLATLFHSYWSKGNDDKKYKFLINGKIKNKNTLVIIKLCALVIKNGMNILNVSLPDRM